jgi:anti-sigma-K factor RskA
MNEQEFAELAAGHALGALSPVDERSYQEALVAHPEWAALAENDAATASLLADTVEPVAPPRALRGVLLAKIDDIPQDGATDEPVVDAPAVVDPIDMPDALGDDPDELVDAAPSPRRKAWSRAWFALAASLAAILAIAGITTVVTQVNRPPAVVALERIDGATDAQEQTATLADGGEVVLHWSESVGEAVLVMDGLPPISADQTFEAWFIRDGAPVSVGLFEAGVGTNTTTALLEDGVEPGDIVAITVEAQGGSSSGAPTTDPLFAIET